MRNGKPTKTLYIGSQPDPDDRLKVQVNDHDYNRIPPRGDRTPVTITDQTTRKKLTVRRASCGLASCYCALELMVEG